MKKHDSIYLLLLFIFSPIATLVGQENQEETRVEQHLEQHKHSIQVMLSHSFISRGIGDDGDRNWITVPSWGINYNYHIDEKWAVGWHNDIMIERFVIEREDDAGGSLERNFPIASLIIGTHSFQNGWAVAFGGGIEYEENESFGVIRAGVEYGVHLPKKWEMIFTFNYDVMLEAYDSFSFGIGVAKLF